MRMLYATTSYNAALLDRVHEEFLLRWQELGHSATIIVPDPGRQRRERWVVEEAAMLCDSAHEGGDHEAHDQGRREREGGQHRWLMLPPRS